MIEDTGVFVFNLSILKYILKIRGFYLIILRLKLELVEVWRSRSSTSNVILNFMFQNYLLLYLTLVALTLHRGFRQTLQLVACIFSSAVFYNLIILILKAGNLKLLMILKISIDYLRCIIRFFYCHFIQYF
jgi:hypothetical protein